MWKYKWLNVLLGREYVLVEPARVTGDSSKFHRVHLLRDNMYYIKAAKKKDKGYYPLSNLNSNTKVVGITPKVMLWLDANKEGD